MGNFINKNKPDLTTEKIKSHKYKFVWLSIPKAASRSLITALYRKPEGNFETIEYHMSTDRLFIQYPEINDYFKFAFVRNPWSRIVSTYKNKIFNDDENVKKHIINKHKGLYTGMPFEKFIKFLLSKAGQDRYSDRHWISQYKLLEKNNKIYLDYLGKMENIEDDLRNICNNIGIPELKIGNLNTRFGWDSSKIKGKEYYYRNFYNEKTKKMVEKRYEKDINLFKYEY